MFVAAMLAATGGFFVWQAAQLDLGNIDLPALDSFPVPWTIIVVLSASSASAIGDHPRRGSRARTTRRRGRDHGVAGRAARLRVARCLLTLGLFARNIGSC